jgi:hypothetical protein
MDIARASLFPGEIVGIWKSFIPRTVHRAADWCCSVDCVIYPSHRSETELLILTHFLRQVKSLHLRLPVFVRGQDSAQKLDAITLA